MDDPRVLGILQGAGEMRSQDACGADIAEYRT
jgi:hypothetical protein